MRLGRAATFAFGAAVATTLAVGCSSSTTATDSGVSPDAQSEPDAGRTDAAADGDAAIDRDGGATDSGVDGGGPVPAYGGPPDSGQIDAGGP